MNLKRASSIHAARGFTFVEVLVAMAFMAIVIPVVIEGLTTTNREGVLAERKRTAVQLADAVLTEAVTTRQLNATEGDFGDDYTGYRWVMTDESWPDPMMHLLTVAVYFNVQGTEFQVHVSTLADDFAVTAAGKTVLGAVPNFLVPDASTATGNGPSGVNSL